MRSALWFLASVLMTSCGRPDGVTDAWTGTVDTLASGRIVIHNPDLPSWEGTWELHELFRLGALMEDGPELFGQIAGLELGPNGEVYVLDGQASEVRVFGSDGAFLRSFGGRGEGPGEIQNGSGLAFDADGTLWVLNWGNGRYSGYDPASGEVRREPRRQVAFASFPWRGEFEEGRYLIDVGLDQGGNPAVLRLDTAFVPADTLALPQPNEEDRVFFSEGSVTIVSILDPFAPRPTWAPRPSGGIVIGEGSSFRFHRIAFTGDTVLTIELDRDPARTTIAERDSATAVIEEMAGALGGSAVANRRPNPRATKPAHGQIFVDDRDRTWVQGIPPSGGQPSWEVFGSEGRFLGTVTIPQDPGSLPPVIRGDRAAVAGQIEGIPTVVVYELIPHPDPMGAEGG